MFKSKRLVVAVSAVVVLVAFGTWYLRGRDPVLAAAKRAIGCARAGDSGCLWSLMMDDEKAAYGLDRDQFDKFFREYVSPRFRPLHTKDMECVGFPDTAYAHCSERWTMPDGLDFSFGMSAAKTDGGSKCPAVLVTLVLYLALLDDKATFGNMGGEVKLLAWAKYAEKNRAELERLGVRGVFRRSEEGLISWDEWIKRCRSRYEEAREHRLNRSAETPGER